MRAVLAHHSVAIMDTITGLHQEIPEDTPEYLRLQFFEAYKGVCPFRFSHFRRSQRS